MTAKGAVREDSEDSNGKVESPGQKVLVLEGGFVKWQEKYSEDKRLTDAYEKDIWEFGY